MNKDKEPPLNEIEKKKLLETVEIIHPIAQEISTKKKSIGEKLKHNLILVVVATSLSGILIFLFQRIYVSTVEKRKAKYELSKEIIDDTLKNTEAILSTSKIIVNLHSEAIEDESQIINANKDYNFAYKNFISNSNRIHFKLKIVFKNDDINKWWDDIQNRIEELDRLLNLLLEIPTNKISETHSERIALCEEKIKKIKSELSLLYDFVLEVFE